MEGRDIIVLAPFESRFLQTLTRTLPIVPLALPAGSVIAALPAGQAPAYAPALRKGNFAHPLLFALSTSLAECDGSAASSNDEDLLKGETECAYRAWLSLGSSEASRRQSFAHYQMLELMCMRDV